MRSRRWHERKCINWWMLYQRWRGWVRSWGKQPERKRKTLGEPWQCSLYHPLTLPLNEPAKEKGAAIKLIAALGQISLCCLCCLCCLSSRERRECVVIFTLTKRRPTIDLWKHCNLIEPFRLIGPQFGGSGEKEWERKLLVLLLSVFTFKTWYTLLITADTDCQNGSYFHMRQRALCWSTVHWNLTNYQYCSGCTKICKFLNMWPQR